MTESMKQAVTHSRQTGKNVFTLPAVFPFLFEFYRFVDFSS